MDLIAQEYEDEVQKPPREGYPDLAGVVNISGDVCTFELARRGDVAPERITLQPFETREIPRGYTVPVGGGPGKAPMRPIIERITWKGDGPRVVPVDSPKGRQAGARADAIRLEEAEKAAADKARAERAMRAEIRDAVAFELRRELFAEFSALLTQEQKEQLVLHRAAPAEPPPDEEVEDVRASSPAPDFAAPPDAEAAPLPPPPANSGRGGNKGRGGGNKGGGKGKKGK